MTRLPAWCRDAVLLGPDAPIPIDAPFTTSDAAAAGVGPGLRRTLVEQGMLRPLLRGVYVATQVHDSFRLRVDALKLVMPEHGIAVERTAAWVHGVDALPRSAIHRMPDLDIFSTAGSRMRRGTIRSGIRNLAARDIEEADGLRLTTQLRTAIDLGRMLWRFDAIAALDGFLRLGVDHSELEKEIVRFKGQRGVRQLRELAPLADPGAESQPESALRLHWHDADLPWPQTQIWVFDDDGTARYRIDVGLEEVRYGAEYFGEEFHAEADEADDADRLEWLATRRAWCMDVFQKEDVYGRDYSAPGRLRRGFELARSTVDRLHPTYIDLGR